jgi:two-component system, OmpR family, response regulator VicR
MRSHLVENTKCLSVKKGNVIPQKKNILVVDDDPEILEITEQNLLNNGFQVTCATDGKDAVKIINKIEFDLIITDLSMPDMDGFELMKELSTLNDDIPIIAVSGFIDDECMLNMAKYLGADYTFKKPFDNYELLKKVNDLLSI